MARGAERVGRRGHALRAALAAAALAIAAGGCAAAPADRPGELFVFAAASLRDALAEVADGFRAATGVETVFNFAGSNVLAQQIRAAPDADVFVSANELWMDHVEAAGLLEPGTRRTVVSNRLVVVANAASPLALGSLEELAAADFRYLALGDPEAVPAGRYAREALAGLPVAGGDLWSRLAARVVPAPDVRAALGLVEATPEAVGIVYRSDAAAARSARVVLEIPPQLGPEIRYVAAALRGRPHQAAARAFLDYLTGPEAATTFVAHGFAPLSR